MRAQVESWSVESLQILLICDCFTRGIHFVEFRTASHLIIKCVCVVVGHLVPETILDQSSKSVSPYASMMIRVNKMHTL